MSWGKIYCDTNWGENKYRTAGSIINEATPDCFQFPEFVSFKDHVRTEGATYEKMQCGIDILLFLGRSISITPQSPDNPTFSGILDTYTGATAGYSTRRLTNTYTGGLIRVRRSSDDAEQDIGYDANGEDLDTFGLLAFVNEDVDIYTSDFTSGNEDMAEVNGTGADGQTIGGVSDAYKFTLSGGAVAHYTRTDSSFDRVNSYDVSFDYYIPSGQTINGIRVRTGTTGDGEYDQTTLDAWTSVAIENWTPTSKSTCRFNALVGSSIDPIDADGDVFYLKNIVITQTTADGHVTTWYDQTGNGNDATNSTASEQPLIVEAGDIIYEGATISRPAVEFDGVDDYLQNTSLVSSTPTTHYLTAKANQSGVLQRFFDGGVSSSTRHSIFQNANQFQYFAGGTFTGGSDDTNQNLHYFLANGTSSEIAINGATASTGSGGTNTLNGLTFAARWDGLANFGDVLIQELIIFDSDQSTNRTGIEGNINNYFSIYTP